MDRVVIEQSLIKTLCFALLAGIMLAAGVWLTYIKHISLMKGIFCIAFFGIVFLYLLYRLLNPRDILVIDFEGFTEASTYLGVGFVPWSNVNDIYVGRVSVQVRMVRTNKKFICVTLHDADAVLSNVSAFKRSIIKMNMSLGYEPVMINLLLASEKRDDVLKMMKEYYEMSLLSRRESYRLSASSNVEISDMN